MNGQKDSGFARLASKEYRKIDKKNYKIFIIKRSAFTRLPDMQKYIEEKFLQPEKDVKPTWTGWKPQPDLSRLIPIGPSHFCDGFDKTIVKIEFGNFQNCYNLVSLDLLSLCNLKEIENCTFQNAWKLREIKLPPSLEIFSFGSFDCCTSLVELDLSGLFNLTNIGGEFFKNAHSLQEIIFPPRVKKINDRSFTNCTRYVKSQKSQVIISTFF
jgi:hypothetical protein